jgi:5-methylcytosine-specific restriction endonuclease McrBC GTP-binding regulatory subunit McrB
MKAKKALKEDRQNKVKTERKFIFIIDEINRAEIAKVFGELFFAIDPGYRGETGMVKTQYSNIQTEKTYFTNLEDDRFYVPENVYIIGTMNDIDRSVESFDFAMRRRFAWMEITAEERKGMWDGQIEPWKKVAGEKMDALNKAIDTVSGLTSSYAIGPAYFLKLNESKGDFNQLWQCHIGVIIKEYLRGMPNAADIYSRLKESYDNPLVLA